ncbi:class I SAM-dependent methyltransferase [Dyella sp. KRB-257]|uniref:class I SAM-dependent methyltransferase n=1 Tax=Dyella sp. KRB-257 TaxID=3400915 RepID=UPI003C035E75
MLNFPINNTMFMTPQSTPESAWLGHIPFAGWLVEEMRPGIFVELGTYRGASYLAFCQAIQRCAVQTKCFAVDSWKGDKHSGEYGEDVYLNLLDYHQRNYADFSRLLKMPFDDAVQYFDERSIDLLHIDGMHTYEAVRSDFETWAPKLSKRAVVLFHDVNVREREFGVWRYWSELASRYPSFEFTHTHGLGVLLVGNEQPEALLHLCRAKDSEETVLINRLFDQMGRLITSNIDIGTLAREQGRLAGLLNETNLANGSLVAENAALKDSCLALELKLDEQLEIYRKEVQRNSELSAGAARAAELATSVEQLQANYQKEVQRNIELSAAAGRAAELATSVDQLQANYQKEVQRNIELATAATKADECTALVRQLQGELARTADVLSVVDQIRSDLSRLSELLVLKNSELERVTMSAHQVELEVEKMKKSLSWRLTSPFRTRQRKI